MKNDNRKKIKIAKEEEITDEKTSKPKKSEPKRNWVCENCERPLGSAPALSRYRKCCFGSKEFECEKCGRLFPRADNRNTHSKNCKAGNNEVNLNINTVIVIIIFLFLLFK